MRNGKVDEILSLRKSRRFAYIRPFPLSSKAALSLTGVGILCFTWFYLGSVNNSNKLEVHEIEALKSLLKEDAQNQRSKREVVEAEQAKQLPLTSRLQKRSIVERPMTVTRMSNFGVTYTRWGRKDCPKGIDTNLVYSGIGAGAYYNHNGGGSNLLCLTLNFTYEVGRFVDGSQDSSSLYGLEYKSATSLDSLWDFKNTEGSNINQHAVPCAVCIASARISQLMIPGIDKCPSGWIKEYSGYIMGPNHNLKKGEYICVDESPQVVPGSGGSQAGARLYFVETNCPSLQCEPYVDARELRCVVCST